MVAWGLFVGAVFFIVPVASLVALAAWTRWLARRTSFPRLALWVAWALIAGMGLLIGKGAFAFVKSAWQVSEGHVVTAPERQQILAAGIARAFYGGALAIGVGVACTLWVGAWTLAWRRRNGDRSPS
jgi:hypothetical protein